MYRINNIYNARWKEREWGDQKDHCFEGLLMAMEDKNREIWLVDSYWGVGNWDNNKFRIKDAENNFNLTYYCNLDEIEKIQKHQSEYYKPEDVFVLHDQHACVEGCRYYYKKIGAEHNKETMLTVLEKRIEEEKHNIDWAKRAIDDYKKKIIDVENNKLDIYI